MKKRVVALILCLILIGSLALAGCTKETNDVLSNSVMSEEEQGLPTSPKTKEDGSKYRIAYVDYDEYLPASQQLFYILSGLKDMGWIICEKFPFTAESASTKEMIYALSEMDLGPYLEFDKNAFYYLGYDKEENVKKGLIQHTEADKDIDLVITFGTSAGVLVKNLDLSVPMVDFSATDPVASGIIDSSTEGSGRDNVWAQVEPSMPLRQLKYYHDIKSFQKLGVVIYGDETISGVPDIQKASEEVGFDLVKINMEETKRETKSQLNTYYKKVADNFHALVEQNIDAFFLTVDVINDMERLEPLLNIFYEQNIPVYVMDDTNTVNNGALLIISTYDFENVGYFIANAVAKILNGAVAGDLPCIYISSPYICLNYDVAMKINYPLNFELLASCDEIFTTEKGESKNEN